MVVTRGLVAMASEKRRYISYLLRLWQVRVGGQVVWRTSLEDAHTSERRGFTNLADLVAFLEGKMGEDTGGGAGPPDSEECE
jgi:hypothetical protein